MSSATIKDIANHLNIAPSTVSRALRDHPDISQERKDAIMKLAKKLDYHPNTIARSLKSNRTMTIGVIIPEIKHNFFSAALDGIEEATYKSGYTILVCKSNEDYQRELVNTRALVTNRADGLLVSIAQNTQNTDHFKNLLKRKIPLVFFDRVCENLNTSKVIMDDYNGAFKAVEHLIKSGYTNIAHLAGPKHLSISRQRLGGYCAALKKHGIPHREEYVIHAGMDDVDGEQGFNQLMKLDEPPKAVLAVNDPVALGIYMQMKKNGLKIPDDMAVVGFSDNPVSSLIDPPMTTVAQHPYEMGRRAAELLLEQMEQGESFKPKTEVLNFDLIIRESA
jgi:LacI family transcriptional regulator